MSLRHNRGLTLVETLVAVALGTVIVGIVIATSVQVQRAISIAELRETATRQIRGLFTDLEYDIARILPTVQMPSPFNSNDVPLALERVPVTPRTGDDAGNPPGSARLGDRFGDRIRIFTTINDQDNIAGTSNPRGPCRAIVEYRLDPQGTSTTDFDWKKPITGGFEVCNLRRVVVKNVPIGSTSVAADGCAPPTGSKPVSRFPVLLQVLSFQIDYVDAKPVDQGLSSSAPSNDVFKAPSLTTDPSPSTVDGKEFLLGGEVTVNEYALVPSDAGATKLLSSLTVGGDVLLFLRDPQVLPGGGGNIERAPTASTVRAKKFSGSTLSGVLLSDRPHNERTVTATVPAKAFVPPALIRFTVIVAFGRGADTEVARFTRVIPVSR